MNLPDIKYLTLICTQPMIAPSGNILVPHQEYTGEIFSIDTEIITDYINYWKYILLLLESDNWHRKGYTKNYLPELIPGYMESSEIDRLYTKTVEMPFIKIKNNSFCLLSDAELFQLGADKYNGKPCFKYTIHHVDDYFDYTSIRRNNILNKLIK